MSCHLLDFVKNSSDIYPGHVAQEQERIRLSVKVLILNKPEIRKSSIWDEMMPDQSRNMTPVTGCTCAKRSFALDRRRERDTT